MGRTKEPTGKRKKKGGGGAGLKKQMWLCDNKICVMLMTWGLSV